MERVVPIDDQPINAAFFGEMRWLTDFITPASADVQALYKEITKGIDNRVDRINACWKYVTSRIKYVKFVSGRIWINGRSAAQNDLWTMPDMTIQTRVGNCAVKSFLLASLLRNELNPDQVYCTLGNLYNGKPGGHAWVSLNLGQEYVMESTTPAAPPMVLASAAKRYEAVHYFNDSEVLAVEGKTQMIPMTACFSTWLTDYLHWAYIESQRHS